MSKRSTLHFIHIFALRPVFRMYRVHNSVTFKEGSSLIITDRRDSQSGGRKLIDGKPWGDKVQQNILVRLAENRPKLESGLL